MKISYKKLWRILVELNMSKADLRKKAGISSGTMTKLRKGEAVTMEILMKICIACNCNAGDVFEFIYETEPSEAEAD